jgi:hypothetical protein
MPEDLPEYAKPLFRLFYDFLAKGVSPDLALTQARAIVGPQPPRPILTIEEFAAIVHRRPETVKKWAATGKIPAVKAPGDDFVLGFQLETALKALTK